MTYCNVTVPVLVTLEVHYSFENQYFFETQYLNANASNPLVVEERDYDRLNRGFNTNLGIEYYLTEKSSLTASGFLRLGDDEDTTTNLTQEFNASNALAVERSRIETETEEDTSLQFSLNYVNNFDDSGHKLTVDLQAEDDKETETSFIDEFNTFPTTELLPAELITQKENQNEYLVREQNLNLFLLSFVVQYDFYKFEIAIHQESASLKYLPIPLHRIET